MVYVKMTPAEREAARKRASVNMARKRIENRKKAWDPRVDKLLVDPEDKRKYRNGLLPFNTETMVTCRCEKHGEYQTSISQIKGYIEGKNRGNGCQKCAQEVRTTKAHEAQRKNMKDRLYPDWVSDWVRDEEDKKRLAVGEIPSSEYISLKCPKCGFEWNGRLSGLCYKKTGEQRGGCAVCRISSHRSKVEDIVGDYLMDIGYYVIRNDRHTIKSPNGRAMELDLYLPDEGLALEFNGRKFHKECDLEYNEWLKHMRTVSKDWRALEPRWKGYHQWKKDRCSELGIKLVMLESEDVIAEPNGYLYDIHYWVDCGHKINSLDGLSL